MFAFDMERQAIMLVAGNKAKGKNRKAKWDGWYKAAIPEAEELFAKHQEQLKGKR